MQTQKIVVSQQSFDSEDHYDLIYSNIENLNGLFARYLDYAEVPTATLQSYHVDYYLAQVENGGFSQFVYNTQWNPAVVQWVVEGLQAMQATQHAALFQQCAAILDQFSEVELEQYLEGEYFGENQQRDVLNQFDDSFYALNESEDLIELNYQWLKQQPQLLVLDESEIEAYLDQIAAQIPDLEQRIQAAKQNQPRYVSIIEALCEAAEHRLDRITAGDPAHEHNGQPLLAWHFLTDQGHFYMLDLGDKAQMLHGESGVLIVEMALTGLELADD